jgi:curved DNA-binding protein CbpA
MKFKVFFYLLIFSNSAWSTEPDPASANLYERLGVSKETALADIQNAYRRLAHQFHPDQVGDDPKSLEAFQRISEAWRVLKKEQSRGAYNFDLRDNNTRFTASESLPKFFKGTPRTSHSQPQERGKSQNLDPALKEFQAKGQELLSQVQVLHEQIKASLNAYHPQVSPENAKTYYRQVSRILHDYMEQNSNLQTSLLLLIEQHSNTKGASDAHFRSESKRLVTTHVDLSRQVFEQFFHFDLYLDDVMAFRLQVDKFENLSKHANGDPNAHGVRELKYFVDSFFRSNYYAANSIRDLLSGDTPSVHFEDEKIMRYALASMAADRSEMVTRDRWVVGVEMIIALNAIELHSKSKASIYQRFLSWMQARVESHLSASPKPLATEAWYPHLVTSLDLLQKLGAEMPEVAKQAQAFKQSLKRKNARTSFASDNTQKTGTNSKWSKACNKLLKVLSGNGLFGPRFFPPLP